MSFFLEKGGQKTTKSGQKRWSETTQKVFNLIIQNPSITRMELSDALQINPSAIQKHIEKLKKLHAIERSGGSKGGKWLVLHTLL